MEKYIEVEVLNNIINEYNNGMLVVDRDTIDDVYQFMDDHSIHLIDDGIDIDTVFHTYPGNGYQIIRFRVQEQIVTVALEMWKNPLGAIFIGGIYNPFEHCTIFVHQTVYEVEQWLGGILYRENIKPVEDMIGPYMNYTAHFACDYGNQEYCSDAIYVPANKVDTIGAAITADYGDYIEAEFRIPKDVRFVIINQESHNLDDIKQTTELTVTVHENGKPTKELNNDQHLEIQSLLNDMTLKWNYVNITNGLLIRVRERKQGGVGVDIPLFAEPEYVLDPMIQKLKATSYTKKRLSTGQKRN